MGLNRSPGLAAGGLACLLGLAWFARLSADRNEQALVRAARDNAALEARARTTAAELAALRRESAQLRAALAPPPARPVPSAPAAGRNFAADLADLVVTDSGLANLSVRALRASIAAQFGRLYSRLGLTPDQIDQFETMLVEHQRELMDIAAGARSQGLRFDDATIVALRLQEDEELGTAELTLLGAGGYQQLQDFTRALPMQRIVLEVANSAALSSSPLTAGQADALTRILTNTNSRFQNGGAADPAAIDWNLVLPEAQGILNETEYQALQGERQSALFQPILNQFRQQEKIGK